MHETSPVKTDAARLLRRADLLQGGYWLVAGLWPVLHLRSFVGVTGPKSDDWLVRTVGGLIACVGAVLLLGISRRSPSQEAIALGLGSGLVLTLADVVYVARGRISRVYLLDALAHVGLFVSWGLTLAGPHGESVEQGSRLTSRAHEA